VTKLSRVAPILGCRKQCVDGVLESAPAAAKDLAGLNPPPQRRQPFAQENVLRQQALDTGARLPPQAAGLLDALVVLRVVGHADGVKVLPQFTQHRTLLGMQRTTVHLAGAVGAA